MQHPYLQSQTLAEVKMTLDRLVARGRRARLAFALTLALRRAASFLPIAVCAGPAALASLRLQALLTRSPWYPVSTYGLVAAFLAGPALWTLLEVIRTLVTFRCTRAQALAGFEHRLIPSDRLRAADEFLAQPARGAPGLTELLKREAILATHAHALAALHKKPDKPENTPERVVRGVYFGLPAAVLLGALATGNTTAPSPVAGESQRKRTPAVNEEVFTGQTRQLQGALHAEGLPGEAEAAESGPSKPALSLTSQPLPAPGSLKGEKARRIASRQGSRGAPSALSQTGPGARKPEGNPTEHPGMPKQKPTSGAVKRPAESAASDATFMPGDSGSEASPPSLSNPKLNKDTPPRVDAPDAPPSEGGSDSEREKDTDESEGSGNATLPMRNEQIRDVDKNLGVGPPAEPPPEARPNGRSGPGEVKKSRGVPTTVLGIPIPDQLHGTPGSGLTQTTIETAPPPASAATLQQTLLWHGPSAKPQTNPKPVLSPWQRRLLQRYFLKNQPRQNTGLEKP